MVGSGLKISGGVLVPTLRLVLLIRSRRVTVVLSMIVGLGYRVSNLRLVGLSPIHHALFVDSAGRCIVGFVKRGGTSVLNVVRPVICRGIVLLRFCFGGNKIPVATSSAPAPKGAISTSGTDTGRNRLYSLAARQDSEASPDVVIGMFTTLFS